MTGLDEEIRWSGQVPTRKFGGMITTSEIKETLKKEYPDIPKDEMLVRVKLEIAYQKEHLKAYLAGKKKFVFGLDKRNKPKYFDVIDMPEKDEGYVSRED